MAQSGGLGYTLCDSGFPVMDLDSIMQKVVNLLTECRHLHLSLNATAKLCNVKAFHLEWNMMRTMWNHILEQSK